jgi:membrane-anchored glycerophosphoryl diester phosphodiesterase (GDPDase)
MPHPALEALVALVLLLAFLVHLSLGVVAAAGLEM